MSEKAENPKKEKLEAPFTSFTCAEFANLFNSQNWRIREKKDGAKRQLIKKEDLKGILSLST